MTYQYPQQSNIPERAPEHPRPGPLWLIVAAVAWTVNPCVWGLTVVMNGWGRDCTGATPNDVPPGCPREGLAGFSAIMMLGFWVLFTAVLALGFGAAQGYHRRFADGRPIAVILVALVMPWAMALYAIGNGFGRLVPNRRTDLPPA